MCSYTVYAQDYYIMARIQVLISPEEREAFRRMALSEGLSLSAWLRQAGLERLAAAQAQGRIESAKQLDEFFKVCDAGLTGREPDLEEQLKVIAKSRYIGQSDT